MKAKNKLTWASFLLIINLGLFAIAFSSNSISNQLLQATTEQTTSIPPPPTYIGHETVPITSTTGSLFEWPKNIVFIIVSILILSAGAALYVLSLKKPSFTSAAIVYFFIILLFAFINWMTYGLSNSIVILLGIAILGLLLILGGIIARRFGSGHTQV